MKEVPARQSYNVAPSYADERFVEMLFDEVEFTRLLNLAETLCLRRRPAYPECVPAAEGEGKIIEKLGTRGLRLAIELSDGLERYDGEEFSNNTPDDPRIYPVDRPDYFNGPMNRDMLAKAEAFGAQLIDEAYDVLGSDTDEYVALFRDATDVNDQFKAIGWLLGRLVVLTGTRGLEIDTRDDDEDMPLYHPIRFSPKAIGRYPNHTIATTCLGVSILTAGFLRKAGADFMHGGVMMSHAQLEMLACAVMIQDALSDKAAEQFGAPFSDLARERLEAKAKQILDTYRSDQGTHSAIYARLVDGHWFQFDPNFNSSTVLGCSTVDGVKVYEDDAAADVTYATLTDLHGIAPGLELPQRFAVRSTQKYISEITNAIEAPGTYRSDIEQLLADTPEESTVKPFCDYILGLIKNTVAGNEKWAKWAQDAELYDYEAEDFAGDRGGSVLENDFYWAFEKFVQWDMPIDEWRERCRLDEAFRRDRTEDIMRLPSVVGLKYALSIHGSGESSMHRPHSIVELGLPDVRIGLSALNNIALYFDNDLSVHHWLSQWSSHLAVTDRLDLAARSRAHKLTLANGALNLVYRTLQYAVTGGKITEHAEALGFGLQAKGVQGEQSEQEEA